jgi:hypothetical protein
VRFADRLLDLDDLVVDLRVAAGQEGAAVDHHVDLVGAELDHALCLGHLEVGRALARRKGRRDGGDFDAAVADSLAGRLNEVRVDTDRGDRGDTRVRRVRPDRLRGERRDLAERVGSLERGQIHHPDGEIERE